MHELAICARIVEAAREEFQGREGVPQRVHVAVGALHQIVPDFLQEAYRALSRETELEGSELRLRFIPVRVCCRACAWEGEIELPFFLCGACGGTAVELREGRELFLEKLTVIEKETT